MGWAMAMADRHGPGSSLGLCLSCPRLSHSHGRWFTHVPEETAQLQTRHCGLLCVGVLPGIEWLMVRWKRPISTTIP
jgi:hypothetical protein